jgi:hypothetical protein
VFPDALPFVDEKTARQLRLPRGVAAGVLNSATGEPAQERNGAQAM